MKYRVGWLLCCLFMILPLYGCTSDTVAQDTNNKETRSEVIEEEILTEDSAEIETDSSETIEELEIINKDPFHKPEGVSFSCFCTDRVSISSVEEDDWWTWEQYLLDQDPEALDYCETVFRGQTITGEYFHFTSHYPGISSIIDSYSDTENEIWFDIERGTDSHLVGYELRYPGPCSEELTSEEAEALAKEFVRDIFDPAVYQIRTEPIYGRRDTDIEDDTEYLLKYNVYFEKPIEDFPVDRYIRVSVAGDGTVYRYEERNEFAFQTYLENYGEEELINEAEILMRTEVLDYAKNVFKEAGIRVGTIKTALTIGENGELVFMIWKEQREDSVFSDHDLVLFVRIQD
ncbi:MAG: hypothetical protein J5589_01995 [Firmicutes bacterium]|nr:hypothetical protein [Bacillota bacterium]